MLHTVWKRRVEVTNIFLKATGVPGPGLVVSTLPRNVVFSRYKHDHPHADLPGGNDDCDGIYAKMIIIFSAKP